MVYSYIYLFVRRFETIGCSGIHVSGFGSMDCARGLGMGERDVEAFLNFRI